MNLEPGAEKESKDRLVCRLMFRKKENERGGKEKNCLEIKLLQQLNNSAALTTRGSTGKEEQRRNK